MERTGGTDPYRLREELQETMQTLVGIYRTKADLEGALARIADIRRRARDLRATGGRAFNPGWNLVFEVRNLIDVSEAIVRSARPRGEPRVRTAASTSQRPIRNGPPATSSSDARAIAFKVTTSKIPAMPKDLRTLAEAGGGA